MNYNKRPTPLFSSEAAKGAVCPVCGFKSYSREGIHPQCSLQRADQKRTARLKRQKARTKSSETQTPTQAASQSSFAVKPWHKRCPRCRVQIHVRRSGCDCGYTFSPTK